MRFRIRLGRTRVVAALTLVTVGLAVGAAQAVTPGVEPATVSTTLNPGESFTVTKTVHTPTIPPKPDIVFLADTTASMGPTLTNVQTNATAIMNDVRLRPERFGLRRRPVQGRGMWRRLQPRPVDLVVDPGCADSDRHVARGRRL